MGRRIKTLLLILLISLYPFLSGGCWNYREIDDMAIIAGVAVDKGEEHRYLVTMEVVELTGGTEAELLARVISVEGDSMFDAVRNVISYIGKKAYWSHAKIVIVSQAIARDGLVKVIDWFSRDTETRENIYLLVSKEDTAKEIFDGKPVTSEVLSFQLDRMLENQKNLGKAPSSDLREFNNIISAEGASPVAPAISLRNIDGKKRAEIMGAAIFKSDRLIGFLDAKDTQTMLLIQNKIKGGVIFSGEKVENTFVTLEIFKSKSKIKPIVDGDNISMEININLELAIDELDNIGDVITQEGRKKLDQQIENLINNRVTKLIKDVQAKYNSDIFGFGTKLYRDKPRVWKKISASWEEELEDIKVNVNTKVKIINSAQLAKPLELGE